MRRRILPLILTMGLIVMTGTGIGQSAEGEEELGGNNLATPVIFAEGYGLSGFEVDPLDITSTGLPGLLKCDGIEYWGAGSNAVDFPMSIVDPATYLLEIDGTNYAEEEGMTTAAAGNYFLQPYSLVPLAGGAADTFGMSTCWEADWADGSEIETVEIDFVDVGDSLVRVLRRASNSPVRVEFTLYQLAATPGTFQDGTALDGYEITQLWPPGFSDGQPPSVGSGERQEVWAVADVSGAGETTPADLASVFTQNARLTIDKLTWAQVPESFADGNLDGYPTGVIPDTFDAGYEAWVDSVDFDGVVGGTEGSAGFSSEVNQGGRVLFGYNWGGGGGLESGWYRITLSIDEIVNEINANASITGVNPADQLADESEGGTDSGSKGFFPPTLVMDSENGNYVFVDVYIAGESTGGGGGGEGQGKMTGKVTTTGGAPLEGKIVTVYDMSGDQTGQTLTGSDGSFDMQLPTGSYHVGVVDPHGSYYGEFYNNRGALAQADDVEIVAGDTVSIDIELSRIGSEPPPGDQPPSGGGTTTPAYTVAQCDFADVDSTNIFCAEIQWMLQQGITKGCSANEFCPKQVATRAQIASMFVRALGLTQTGDVDRFGDDNGSVHEQDINRLAYAGITLGCSANEYCPDEPMTRAQMASMFARAFQLTEGADVDRFGDDNGSVHEQNINRVAYAGITLGCAENEFCPDGLMLREQLAAFFYRAMN